MLAKKTALFVFAFLLALSACSPQAEVAPTVPEEVVPTSTPTEEIPPTPTSPPAEELIAVIEQLYSAMNEKDLDASLAMFSPEAEIQTPEGPARRSAIERWLERGFNIDGMSELSNFEVEGNVVSFTDTYTVGLSGDVFDNAVTATIEDGLVVMLVYE